MPQTQMSTFMGRAPALDSEDQLDNLAFKLNVVAKTVDYTVLASESGTVFTTLGATEAQIIFTLPAASAGLTYWFLNYVDIDLTVKGAATDLLVTGNNATADEISFTTASEQIGCGFQVICDGTYWFCIPIYGGPAFTVTITDA